MKSGMHFSSSVPRPNEIARSAPGLICVAVESLICNPCYHPASFCSCRPFHFDAEGERVGAAEKQFGFAIVGLEERPQKERPLRR